MPIEHRIQYTCTKCGKTFYKIRGDLISGEDLLFSLNPVCDKCKLDSIINIFKK